MPIETERSEDRHGDPSAGGFCMEPSLASRLGQGAVAHFPVSAGGPLSSGPTEVALLRPCGGWERLRGADPLAFSAGEKMAFHATEEPTGPGCVADPLRRSLGPNSMTSDAGNPGNSRGIWSGRRANVGRGERGGAPAGMRTHDFHQV
ncbi:hypothetical protein D4764_21G0003670 [Takifugu flavidus]|uniref:Uncharacterized protein n=1 Tax=Takifugu flavidus TaxID=433684 RepID=A0A5C6NIM2_9TELE|nr:hypothetical protein D4764_21G0003670 [Takifugu flavidus]